MQSGVVKWYNEARGRGVIVPDEAPRELVVAHSDILNEGFKILYEGQRVRFDVVETAGGLVARNVEVSEEK